MSLNIVDLVKNQLGGEVINKLGGLIGATPDTTKSAVGAAVPALLAGLTGLASKPEGAQQLAGVLARQDDSLLGNLSGMLGSQGSSIAEKGTSLLSSLFGGNALSGLLGGLSKYTGLGNNSIGSLLGALAPIVLGVLGRQSKSMNLDAGGLANLLAGQKQNIMSAMPSGLGSLLGSVPGLSGLLGSVTGAAGSAASAVAGAAGSAAGAVTGAAGAAADAARAGVAGAARTAETAAQTVQQAGSSVSRWLIPVIVLAALALLFWQCRKAPTTTPPEGAPGSTLGAPDATRLTADLTGVFETARTSLGAITDEASARAAVPKIEDLNRRLEGLLATWSGVPASARPAIQNVIRTSMGPLKEAIDKANTLPGVGLVLRPATDVLITRLNEFLAV